jgi:hypothetical protein
VQEGRSIVDPGTKAQRDILEDRSGAALLVRLARRGIVRSTTAVKYDAATQMSRIGNELTFAIDYRGVHPPTTKKFDVERGEDQKERW